MLIFEKIFMVTLFYQEVLLCSLELLTVCKKKLLHHLRGNTLFGLVDLSCRLYPHSNKCGSQNKSMTRVDHRLFTGNASNFSKR